MWENKEKICFFLVEVFFWLVGLIFLVVLFRGRENEQQRGIWLSRLSHSSRWQRCLSTPVWHFGETMWLEGKWIECSSFPEIISRGFIFNLFPSILWYELYGENPEVSTAAFWLMPKCVTTSRPRSAEASHFLQDREQALALLMSSLPPSHNGNTHTGLQVSPARRTQALSWDILAGRGSCQAAW